MIIELHFDTIKFVVTRFKTNYDNINFKKLVPTIYMGFSDTFWDYWIYNTWEQMNQAWTEYYNPVFPPEDSGRYYFDEEYM
jgi:hypothetical protein